MIIQNVDFFYPISVNKTLDHTQNDVDNKVESSNINETQAEDNATDLKDVENDKESELSVTSTCVSSSQNNVESNNFDDKADSTTKGIEHIADSNEESNHLALNDEVHSTIRNNIGKCESIILMCNGQLTNFRTIYRWNS